MLRTYSDSISLISPPPEEENKSLRVNIYFWRGCIGFRVGCSGWESNIVTVEKSLDTFAYHSHALTQIYRLQASDWGFDSHFKYVNGIPLLDMLKHLITNLKVLAVWSISLVLCPDEMEKKVLHWREKEGLFDQVDMDVAEYVSGCASLSTQITSFSAKS